MQFIVHDNRNQERKYQSQKIKSSFRISKIASLHLESKIEIILRRFSLYFY